MSNFNLINQTENILPKASVRTDGKLYFSKSAGKLMQLNSGRIFKIAKGTKERCLFLFPSYYSPGCLIVGKAGPHYYLKNYMLWRRLGLIKGEKYLVTTAVYGNETIYKIHL